MIVFLLSAESGLWKESCLGFFWVHQGCMWFQLTACRKSDALLSVRDKGCVYKPVLQTRQLMSHSNS